MTPAKVGIILFIVCTLLGIGPEKTLIICSVHYIAHSLK